MPSASAVRAGRLLGLINNKDCCGGVESCDGCEDAADGRGEEVVAVGDPDFSKMTAGQGVGTKAGFATDTLCFFDREGTLAKEFRWMNVEGFPGISGIGITATVAHTGMGRTIDAMLGAVAHLDVAQVVSGHLPNLPDGWPLAGGFTGKIDAALEVPGLHFLEGVLQSNTGLAESSQGLEQVVF